MNNIKLIFKIIKEMNRLEKRILPCIFISATVSAVLPFVNILFSSKIIDALDTNAQQKELFILIAVAVILNFVLMFLNHYTENAYYSYRRQMYNKERQNIACKLYSVEYSKLESSDFKELVHKHAEAQDRVYSAFVQFAWMIRDFICGFITLAAAVIILIPLFKIGFTKTGESFFERPAFLITIFCAIAVMAVIILLLATKMNKAWFKTSDEYSCMDRVFSYFLNMFNDYKTGKEIRLYNEQELIRHKATDVLLSDGEKLLRKTSAHTAKTSSAVAVLGAFLGFGIYLFIGIKGLYGLYSIGSLVLYSGAFMQIINGVMKMANTFGKTAEMCPLAEYYFRITEADDTMSYGTQRVNIDEKFEIEFKNVSFRYPQSENYALKNVNLKIHNGDHLAVVGRNGSGKTTFIKLMCRLYDVTDGEILINGINIKEYTKQSLLDLYSVVFQDFQIFSLPLYENIAANDNYSSSKLWNSLEEASIKERVENMPIKEKTYLYKNIDKSGIEISGGEAQKLALARALYKNSPIIILDEPTAALDPVAENEIYNHFNSFVKEKTAIYISHRLSSCVFCNRIAVFDNSRLVQTGSHTQLLEDEKGTYSKLWNAQAEYYL